MTQDSGKTEAQQSPEQLREDLRRYAAQAIQRHFSSHPDCVIIATISNGKLKCDVTPTVGLGDLLNMERIIKKKVAEAYDNTLALEQKLLREAARPFWDADKEPPVNSVSGDGQ